MFVAKHSEEMKMQTANHNSSLSFYPFNKMPSHQNVCTKDKSEYASSFGFVVAVKWYMLHGICYECSRYPYTRQSCTFHILWRCMAINTSGRIRSSLPLAWTAVDVAHKQQFLHLHFSREEHSALASTFIQFHCIIVCSRILLPRRCVTFAHSKCKIQQQQIKFIWVTSRQTKNKYDEREI